MLRYGRAIDDEQPRQEKREFEKKYPTVLIVFVAFIPFFAFKELGRVLGEDKIWTLFFRKRAE
jgi:hypothetical protein